MLLTAVHTAIFVQKERIQLAKTKTNPKTAQILAKKTQEKTREETFEINIFSKRYSSFSINSEMDVCLFA